MAGTVTVACKVPNGVILQLYKQEDWNETSPGGAMRKTKRAVKNGESVHIKGPAVPFGQQCKLPVQGGYALNTGIDADLWAEWCRQNAGCDMLNNNLIFANEKVDSVVGKAKEHKETQSGLQPLNPEFKTVDGRNIPVDPRYPKGRPGLHAVTTADKDDM